MASNYEAISIDNIRRRGEEFDDIGRFLAQQFYSDQTHLYTNSTKRPGCIKEEKYRRPDHDFTKSVYLACFQIV